MHKDLLYLLLCSASLVLHSLGPPCLGNVATHNEVGLPTPIKTASPQTCPQAINVDNCLLRLSSQVILDGVKLTAETITPTQNTEPGGHRMGLDFLTHAEARCCLIDQLVFCPPG